MDFGAVGLDGLVCSDNNSNGFATSHSLIAAAAGSGSGNGSNLDPDNTDTKQQPKWYGSAGGGFLKQQERERERSAATEDDWRDLKLAKTSEDFSPASKAMLLFQQQSQRSSYPALVSRSNDSSLHHSDGHQRMLSFSSPNSQTATLPPCYPYTSTAAAYPRNTGYGSGGGLNMHGGLVNINGVRGPFTPSQWMELEHQALIYKYINANAPIPSNLLIPIRKALETAGFSTFPGGHLRHNAYGWGAFHLGFSSSSDPEPGRCRRTDGKKWRCSRDAVADQKYCERHMNRGRHRSRKPVEGQAGHSVSGGPTTTTTSAKVMPMSSSTSATAVVASCGRDATNIVGHLHHHHQQISSNMQAASTPASSQHNRTFLNKGDLGEKIEVPSGNRFSISKLHNLSDQEPARSEFGLVYSDSLLNPLHKNTSLNNCTSYGSSKSQKQQHSLRQFMDDWPHSDRTQLSISIPMDATSDFTDERLRLSPLRLSRELEPTQMGLGMGTINNEPNQRKANWIPISWENSHMGGPLGEVLHGTNSTSTGEIKNASALNLMTEGWDSSPRMALSPTGVLQKTAFGSLSNSSAGSSPRTENNLLGSTLIGSSFPSL